MKIPQSAYIDPLRIRAARARFPGLTETEVGEILKGVDSRLTSDLRTLASLARRAQQAGGLDAEAMHEIRFVAHRLRGLCVAVGLTEIAEHAGRVEQSVRDIQGEPDRDEDQFILTTRLLPSLLSSLHHESCNVYTSGKASAV